MAFEFFDTRIEAGVGWLEQNAQLRNAYGWPMLRELPLAMASLLDDDAVHVVVFASALEAHFSVSSDLATFAEIDTEGMAEWVTLCHQLVNLMHGASKPLLAAINGTAVGGGLEYSLHWDIRFAGADARLGQTEIAIAFIPPVGASVGPVAGHQIPL